MTKTFSLASTHKILTLIKSLIFRHLEHFDAIQLMLKKMGQSIELSKGFKWQEFNTPEY